MDHIMLLPVLCFTAALVVVIIRMNVWYWGERSTMTQAERDADDDEMQIW